VCACQRETHKRAKEEKSEQGRGGERKKQASGGCAQGEEEGSEGRERSKSEWERGKREGKSCYSQMLSEKISLFTIASGSLHSRDCATVRLCDFCLARLAAAATRKKIK